MDLPSGHTNDYLIPVSDQFSISADFHNGLTPHRVSTNNPIIPKANSAQGAGSGIACMKTDLLFDPPTSIDKESSREIGVSVDPSSVVGHLQFEAVDAKIAW